jgi:hypothetical protein
MCVSLNKLAYFIDTGIFCIAVTDGSMLSCLGGFNLVTSGHVCVSLNKLEYFIDTGVFCVALTDGCALPCLCGFNLDILSPIPSLCSYFVCYYLMMLVFLVLFTDFLVGV